MVDSSLAESLGSTGRRAVSASLRCELQLPARVVSTEPVVLTMRLTNPAAGPVTVLTWGTPFEGMWTGHSVEIERDGSPVEYLGPMVKRGAPAAAEYLRLSAGGAAEAALRLDDVFDLTQPGSYRIRPRFVLHDVVWGDDGRIPTPPDAMREAPLRCPEGRLEVLPHR